MPFYAIRIGGDWKTLSTVGKDRADALSQFSEMLGYKISENKNGRMTDLMMDEWDENPHWLNPQIAIFRE